PRLRLTCARAGAGRAPDPLLHQPAAQAFRADPARAADLRGLAGEEAAAEDARPQGPPPLAGRAHERLAESTPPDRHPSRPQSRELPRLPRAGDDRHPRAVVLRSVPVPTTVASLVPASRTVSPLRGLSLQPRRRARSRRTAAGPAPPPRAPA